MILLLLLLLHPPADSTAVPQAERRPLIDLFEACGGPSWINHDGWGGPSGTECSWAGVECRPDDSTPGLSHVFSIDLARNRLTGSLPASLATLPHLARLTITGNRLDAPLPEALVALWERGLLDIRSDQSLTDVTEVRLLVSTNVYCANEAVLITRDGSVSYYRERCRKPRATNPKPYCELRQAKTGDFSRLTRFLSSTGFFSSHSRPSNKGVWVDVAIVTVTAFGPFGIQHTVE
ncbi:hypothetical protein EG835_07310, partial [bacterium]|nr:hypothetical protein [bacterium]